MQVRHAAAAGAAAHARSELDGREGVTKARDQVGRIENAPVLAAAAHRHRRHLGAHELSQGSADACLPCIPVAGTELVRRFHEPVIGLPMIGRRPQSPRHFGGLAGSVAGNCERHGKRCSSAGTKSERSSEAAVETRHDLPETLEQLLALEREFEREWWWLNGALHAAAQVQAEAAHRQPQLVSRDAGAGAGSGPAASSDRGAGGGAPDACRVFRGKQRFNS